MWDLAYLVLKPRRSAPDELRIKASFDGSIDAGQREDITNRLRDRWEPFDTTALANGNVLLWFRRPAEGEPQVIDVSELPGQYL